jgi:hypothetical protein
LCIGFGEQSWGLYSEQVKWNDLAETRNMTAKEDTERICKDALNV